MVRIIDWKCIRLVVLVCLGSVGCGERRDTSETNIPTFPAESQVTRMTVVIANDKNLGDFYTGKKYQVKRKDIAGVLSYIAPKRKCELSDLRLVTSEVCPVLCTVVVVKSDGTTLEIKVASTGQNPLVVTMDGGTYYWGTFEGEGRDSGYLFIQHIRELNGIEWP